MYLLPAAAPLSLRPNPLWEPIPPTLSLILPFLMPFLPQGGLRLLIQESVWDEAMRRLRARMAQIRSGRGLDGAVDMGARGAAARDLAQSFVDEAQSQGGQVSPNCTMES